MMNRLLLCLLIVCVTTNLVYCRFGSRSSGRSRSSGSHSWGWGSSSSSHSSYKPSSSSSSWNKPSYPSSSSGLSGSGWSKPSYPSSSSGLSGSGWSKPSYPSSSSGLSGSGWSKPSYPSSSSGLSGSGWSKPSYPPSSSGLSGSGWSKPSYPSSSSGLSGSGASKPSYPSSSTGLSGSGPQKPSLTGTGPHIYPPSIGISGNTRPKPPSYSGVPVFTTSNGNSFNKPSYDTPDRRGHTYNSHSSYGGYNQFGNTHTTYVLPKNYHTYPQYVYVTDYRNSGSRYGDILTGLALYNMGRSHSHHYHDHYYYDDYYRARHHSPNYAGNSHINSQQPNDKATCTLRVKENGRLEVLKVPCEIVSTFVEDGKRSNYTQTQTNTNICLNITTETVNKTETVNATSTTAVPNNSINITTPLPAIQNTTEQNKLQNVSETIVQNTTENAPVSNITAKQTQNVTFSETTESQNVSKPLNSQNTTLNNQLKNDTVVHSIDNTTVKIDLATAMNNTVPDKEPKTSTTVSKTVTTYSNTTCTTVTNITDPLQVKGPPVNTNNTECEVEIVTKDYLIRNKVDCSLLLKYSQMPEKEKPKEIKSSFLPPKSKIKSWLDNPPWWLSVFIAV